MRYTLALNLQAQKDLAFIKKTDSKSFKKLEKLLAELQEHPYSGTGNPEQLRHELSGFWSRKINRKDRIIYKINDLTMTVQVISAKGHYGNK